MNHNSFTTKLALAYAPISNYDFTIVKKEKIIQQVLNESMLYIIAQRAELTFENVDISKKDGILRFNIKKKDSEDLLICQLSIHQELLEQDQSKYVEIKCGFYDTEILNKTFPANGVDGFHFFDSSGKFLLWVSPDKFLYLYHHKLLQAEIEGNLDLFTEYKVHYVGKATDQKVYDRLTGHNNLQKILSLEKPFHKGSLPTHEIMLLLFKVKEALGFITAGDEEGISNLFEMVSANNSPDDKVLSLDVEKALIKLLNPKYNDPKKRFGNYPKSTDGMFKYKFNAFSYQIMDNLKLKYEEGSINGSIDPAKADIIFIKDNSELLLKKMTVKDNTSNI